MYVNMADFCLWFSMPNCLDTSKPKGTDTLRLTYDGSFCKHYA